MVELVISVLQLPKLVVLAVRPALVRFSLSLNLNRKPSGCAVVLAALHRVIERSSKLAWCSAPISAPISVPVTLLPLSNCLLIDAVALGKRSQALLTSVYCSANCLCRRGAAV